MTSDYEERLDKIIASVFEDHHPAVLDWKKVKEELKELRSKDL